MTSINFNENILNIIQNGDNKLREKWLNRLDMRKKSIRNNIEKLNEELEEITELIDEINKLPVKSNIIQLIKGNRE